MWSKFCNKLIILCSVFWLSQVVYADSTSLRCYYRNDPTSAQVSYYWALNENGSDEYQLPGVWRSPVLPLANIFYTHISDQALRARCEDTLKRAGIYAPLAMYAAADHRYSYNYLVWNIDTKSTNQQQHINRIVSFGDSLSDTNNLFNGGRWLEDPSKKTYYAGRFSNGPNWLDYLSEQLKLPVYNWAIGGAGTIDYNLQTGESGYWPGQKLIKIDGIRSQVDSWLNYMDTSFMGLCDVNSNRYYNPKNTLFTVLIGGNDLLHYGTPIAIMVDQERQALISLIDFGATHILLSTLPDLSRAPLFLVRKFNQDDPKTDPEKVHERLIQFNDAVKKLGAELQAIYGDQVNIHVYDAYAVVNDLLREPQRYGIINTINSCLAINEETLDTYSKEGEMNPACLDAANKADSFVFWDLIHPTTHTHKIMAEKAVDFVREKFPVEIDAKTNICRNDRADNVDHTSVDDDRDNAEQSHFDTNRPED